jgi:thioredoxin-like negative regulator of GroEL
MRSAAEMIARDAAIAAYHRGAPDALALLQSALQDAPHDGGLLICEAGARHDLGDPDPLARLRAVLDLAPDWVDGHVAYARIAWESQLDAQPLARIAAALARLPDHAALWVRYMGLLVDSGQAVRAADVAADLLRRTPGNAELMLLEARYAGLGGDLARASRIFARLPPDWADKALDHARHCLRLGDIAAATVLLDNARSAAPTSVAAWALSELAWRASGDPRHDWLLSPAMVEQFRLPLTDAELTALIAAVRACHHAQVRPLGQSVRDGTQTRGILHQRADPAIVSFFEAVSLTLADYWQHLPPTDLAHPLLRARDRALAIVGSWSIRIVDGGYHISHIHDSGLLSSACHLVVPAPNDAEEQAGWLELGRPPADIPLPLAPLHSIAPRPAHLVLFPAFLYHGTRRFASGERLTIAFDAA